MNIIKLIMVGIFTAASLAHAGDAQVVTVPVGSGSVSLIGVSGNTILDRCTKRSDQDQAYCLAWIRLAAENAMQMKAIDPKLPLCIPKDVDDAQLRDVAIEHLRRNAKDRHMAATILVAEAFYAAWPCQTNKDGQKSSLPALVQTEIDKACEKPPVLKSGFVTVKDINGDGLNDYVLDYNKFECDGDSLLYCGSAGCLTTVFASLPDGSYVKVLNENVRRIKFGKLKGRYAMILDLHGSACGRAGAALCAVTLFWNGQAFSPAN